MAAGAGPSRPRLPHPRAVGRPPGLSRRGGEGLPAGGRNCVLAVGTVAQLRARGDLRELLPGAAGPLRGDHARRAVHRAPGLQPRPRAGRARRAPAPRLLLETRGPAGEPSPAVSAALHLSRGLVTARAVLTATAITRARANRAADPA